MKPSGALKPQDVLVLLKMAAHQDRQWRIVDLAQELGLSISEVSTGLERAKRARLVDNSKKRVVLASLLEFVLHGLKYVYPAEPGALCRGVPTGHSAAPLAHNIVSEPDDQYVWPWSEGNVRGQGIEPLYNSAPRAALNDRRLHELLALVDALRVGRARERQLAGEELKRRLHGG